MRQIFVGRDVGDYFGHELFAVVFGHAGLAGCLVQWKGRMLADSRAFNPKTAEVE